MNNKTNEGWVGNISSTIGPRLCVYVAGGDARVRICEAAPTSAPLTLSAHLLTGKRR